VLACVVRLTIENVSVLEPLHRSRRVGVRLTADCDRITDTDVHVMRLVLDRLKPRRRYKQNTLGFTSLVGSLRFGSVHRSRAVDTAPVFTGRAGIPGVLQIENNYDVIINNNGP